MMSDACAKPDDKARPVSWLALAAMALLLGAVIGGICAIAQIKADEKAREQFRAAVQASAPPKAPIRATPAFRVVVRPTAPKQQPIFKDAPYTHR